VLNRRLKIIGAAHMVHHLHGSDSAPGRPEESVTLYERVPGGSVIARITVECRSVVGTPVSVTAPVGQEPHEAVEARLHNQCGKPEAASNR